MGNVDSIGVPMALTALRQGTADLHRAVERQVPLMSKRFNRVQYIAWLQLMHPFYSAVDGIVLHEDKAGSIEWAYLPRAPLIEQDLAWLNAHPKDNGLQLPLELCGLGSTYHRLGILYVVEGSSLGGQILHKALTRTTGVTAHHGARFLTPHGPDPRPRWASFINCLRPYDDHPDAIATMVVGAQSIFAAMLEWIQRGWQQTAISETVV